MTTELRTWGNRLTGEIHYIVNDQEVTKEEYLAAWQEYQESLQCKV